MGRERLFRFKQFAVSHQAAAMKVGTDGVTVGAWAPCGGRVLDVGCGCGLIGLMAAQRGAREVEMVEIDSAAAAEAADNVLRSPWADRIRVHCADFLDFSPAEPFDNIISNPPFFADGLHAPDNRRAAARHESGLSPEAFMRKAASLLSPIPASAAVSIIIPPDRYAAWAFAADLAGLHPAEVCELLTKPAAPARRVLVSFVRGSAPERSTRLIINSPEYQQLTSPFYL